MQATLFGAACIDQARAERAQKKDTGVLWTDEDVAFEMGLENWNAFLVPQPNNPKRLFNVWFEDWWSECP